MTAELKPVIDQIVFCDVHSSEPVKLHCSDCEKLICLLCSGTTHKQHTLVTNEPSSGRPSDMSVDPVAMPVGAEAMPVDAEAMPVDATPGLQPTALESQVNPPVAVKNYHDEANKSGSNKSTNKTNEAAIESFISVNDLMRKEIKLQSSFDLNFNCNRFEIINNKLLCVEHNTSRVHIYSTDGAKQRIIVSDVIMGGASGIARVIDKALVSSSKGLFTISLVDPCHDDIKVFDGHFDDVCSRGSLVYALTRAVPAEVVTISYSETLNTYTKQSSFKLVIYQRNIANTIEATSDHVFLAQYCIHIIQQYSLHGQIIRTYDTYDVYNSGGGGVKLRYPLLSSSGYDKTNSVLVAGNANRCLDVLTADGSFRTLPVDGIGESPACARIHEDDGSGSKRLYVLCWIGVCPMQVFSIT